MSNESGWYYAKDGKPVGPMSQGELIRLLPSVGGSFELVVRSEFRAAHQLRMPDGGVEPLHEHAWRVEVFLESEVLDDAGLVADFTVLRGRIAEATRHLTNACLNELSAFAACNPSTEMIAKHLCELIAPLVPDGVALTKVRVWETDDCAAGYRPPADSR